MASKPRQATRAPSLSKGKTQTKAPSVSRIGSKKNVTAAGATDATKKTKRTEWALPAFSILPKKPKEAINWEDLKKKTIRRHAPEGEDIKGIRAILKELQQKPITVHEFINTISAYTSDNGQVLRQLLEEDVDSFRKLARKVYETQTQDVSDVLVNEQLQLVNYYQEKHDIYTEKMMNAINEIFEVAPQFDFERYYRDKEDYLNAILPLPVEVTRAPEELEMQRRQMAYHRLQWLRSEGERMHEENVRLQRRLEQLKAEQKSEQARMAGVAAKAEEERQNLAQQEAQLKEHLQTLNEDVEKSIIENEAQITRAHKAGVIQPSTGAVKKTASGIKQKKGGKRLKKRPEWVSEVAADIEDQAAREVVAVEAEAAREPPGALKKRMFRRPEMAPQQAPQGATAAPPRQTSPFHFSPEAYRGLPQPQPTQDDIRVETHTTHFHERRPTTAAPVQAPGRLPRPASSQEPQSQQFRGRRGQAPRDTWGGFN